MSEVGDKDIADVHVPFRQKAVYYYWNQQVQEQWRFEDDPFESAQKYLAEAAAESKSCIQPLDVIAPAGTRALAFYITDFTREWAQYTQELALDSTCGLFSFH
ncbi:MAG TPA: hypothetical protein VGO47_08785 [Chlamydiales bacterium]|nr:hypothetical protein [Chlamydiales bacterium]